MKLPHYIFLLIFFIALLLKGVAQTNNASPRIEFFSIPNSAINSEEISDIKIDRDGFVWIVSFKSLYKFDGETFQKITANYNSFGSLIRFHESEEGLKYIIDYWGAIYFVRNDSLFEFEQNAKISKYYKSYGYSSIEFYNSEYHFAYNGSSYKVLKKGEISDPLKESDVSFSGTGIQTHKFKSPFIFYGNKSKKTEKERVFLFNKSFEKIDSVAINQQNWYNPTSTTKLKKGSFLFSDGKGNLVEFYDDKIINVLEYPFQIINLFTDIDGGLWISTRGEGVHYYKNGRDIEGKKKVLLSKSTTIVSDQDYQGGIWIYSQNKGIGYISHPKTMFINETSNVKPLVETLEVIEGKIITSDKSKLLQLEEKSFKEIHKFEGPVMRTSYDTTNSRLWVSIRGNLLYIENGIVKEVKNFKDRIKGNFSYLNSDWQDSTISLIGTNGYNYFVCKNDTISYVSKNYDYKLKGVVELKGSRYINSGNGIFVENKDSTYYLGSRFALARKSVDQFVLFDNCVLFSIPSEGLYLFKENSYTPILYNGSVVPTSVLIKQGELIIWAISNYGTFKIEKDNESGISVKEFSALPRMVLKKGVILNSELYLQTRNNGIGYMDLNGIENSPAYAPRLLINKFSTSNINYFQKYDIKPIEYKNNNIQISFRSLNYQNLDVTYRYKLNGLNTKWTETKTGFVNYVSLSPNNYNFNVQSRFGLGNWSESKTISFKIIPPIWQRWWFLLFVIIVLVVILYQIVNYRFQRIDKEKSLVIGRLTAEQKALRTKMDPHFIFNAISSVQYLILRKKNERATLFLNRFSALLRNTLNQSTLEFVSIKKEIQFLTEYVELERMRLEDSFDFEITISLKINEQIEIPTFIIQPFIENAIHHGLKALEKEGKLHVKFELIESLIKVTIEDNGAGLNKTLKHKTIKKNHTSLGVSTVKDRLKLYQGKQRFESVSIQDRNDLVPKEKGTISTLYIKIKNI